jgi:hypothetical protein
MNGARISATRATCSRLGGASFAATAAAAALISSEVRQTVMPVYRRQRSARYMGAIAEKCNYPECRPLQII